MSEEARFVDGCTAHQPDDPTRVGAGFQQDFYDVGTTLTSGNVERRVIVVHAVGDRRPFIDVGAGREQPPDIADRLS
jgi:hypothetical protein